eukprot:10514046-Lingulodinium_polyedra.AAC.1
MASSSSAPPPMKASTVSCWSGRWMEKHRLAQPVLCRQILPQQGRAHPLRRFGSMSSVSLSSPGRTSTS